MRKYFKISTINDSITEITENTFYNLVDFANDNYDDVFHSQLWFDSGLTFTVYAALNGTYESPIDYSPICFYVDIDFDIYW